MILFFNIHIYFIFNQVGPIETADVFYKAKLVKEWRQHKKLTASNRKKTTTWNNLTTWTP